jgi:serine/threonine protein kinase/Tfp pilus assembly protein PilF
MNDLPNRDVVIFTEAVDLPADERAAYLERACGGDAELRQRVESLLQTDDRVGDFLELASRETAILARAGGSTSEKPGDRIGRYKLLQQIGEGGCGVVYMAEQEEPVRRRVALKIIKLGMDTKSVIARFEAERQVLALMDHPNIAKVFDAGATESGRPYFVMQLVHGDKITEYCDQNSLTTEERLKLFIQVCQAIQHAHQKGIIHRDIKPSNILVTTTLEGGPLPVVIDFGIAKATTNQPLTDKTVFTAFDMLIGTPAYMSPEQAARTSVDVDTRSDIYSLGVLLYELLTSSTPFEVGELLKEGLDEIRRVIREQEPVRPSTRLSKLTGADLTTVAQHRKSEPPTLVSTIRGDLDWIAMKALEKDRTRRYETANGLALDVQRFLSGEAVSARPPSAAYKLQKLVLRNKLLCICVSVIAVLLVASLIAVSASLAKERQARHEADAALRQAEADKAKAQTETVKSQQVIQFLEKMLQGVGPSVAQGQDTKMLRGILDRTAESVGKAMTNQPTVEADLRSLTGRIYVEIGNYDRAEEMYRAALAINRKLFGPNSPEVAVSLNDLGIALCKEDKLTEAESAHQEALEIRRRLFGNENADVAASLNDLATVFRHQGRKPEAEALTREALSIRRKLFGDDSLEAADTLHNLSVVLGDEDKRAEAESAAKEMLAIRRRLLGNDNPLVASALVDVAWAANGSGKLDEAISTERDALAMQRKFLGDEAPDVAKSLNTLGQMLARQGKLEESHALLLAALSDQRKFSGDDNPDSLVTLRSLGLVLEAEGKLTEAEKVHREALTLWRKRGENETPLAVSELESLTRNLIAQKKFGDAKQILDEALTPAFTSQSSSGNLLALRVDLNSRRGQWQEAAADAALAFEHQPLKNERYSVLAALLVKNQNRPAYEQLRDRLLSTFAKTTNIFVADQVAKSCLFLPSSGADLQVIGHLADTAVTLGIGDTGALPFFQDSKALSEYRQGRYADAIEWAQKPLKIPGIYVHGHSYAVLAMSYWRLGQQDEARAMLAKGDALEPPIMPPSIAEDPGNAWLAWLFARIALDEAAALIQSGPTTDRNPNRP